MLKIIKENAAIAPQAILLSKDLVDCKINPNAVRTKKISFL
ncbi:hypothetical protein Nizo2257_0716 [Lactiplantibacillus plantarum]|nr:hypothetical protein Nizo2257_0716 [Lactiplantibacillus plantarum]